VLGNVSEWVNDWWGANYPTDPIQDPPGPTGGTLRAIRSGSYRHTDKFSRFSARDVAKPEEKVTSVGVRCAMDAAPQ
jgi:formylglycine-generating enzyme required for sulfatase activity